ncbi:hypothetical protein GF380_02335 [Candidatus Uhrbacteria bacterium]|nr:hypothetical protein [Candidatus Uhrbacteria bacterium]
MADIGTLSTLRIIASNDQFDAPSAETFAIGEAVRVDSNGKVTPANATSVSEAKFRGIAANEANYAGEAITVLTDGTVDAGDVFSSVAIDTVIYLSTNDGRWSDSDVGRNEIQTITVSTDATGGTYQVIYDGATSSALAYDANAATIEAALEAMSTIDVGNVRVTGTGPYTVEFMNDLGDQALDEMTTATGSILPATATVTVAEATAGYSSVAIGTVVPLWSNTTADKGLRVKA